jgi:hypothetical protein
LVDALRFSANLSRFKSNQSGNTRRKFVRIAEGLSPGEMARTMPVGFTLRRGANGE